MPKNAEVHDSIVRRVKNEFAEMPGLQLTRVQAERLWALDGERCGAVLDTLVESGFLRRGMDGRYRRSTDDLVRGSAARVAAKATPAPAPSPSPRATRHHDAA